MIENQDLIEVNEETLLSKVYDFFHEGYRIVQIHCTRLDTGFELNYSFDKNYKFTNLRMVIGREKEISSVSGIYWNAFLYENEIADLFGVKIKNMAIDYKGKLYQSTVKAPFAAAKPASEIKE